MSDNASLITMIVYMGFIWPIVFYTLIRHRGVPEKINARIVFFAILFLITGDSALMITRIVCHFMYSFFKDFARDRICGTGMGTDLFFHYDEVLLLLPLLGMRDVTMPCNHLRAIQPLQLPG